MVGADKSDEHIQRNESPNIICLPVWPVAQPFEQGVRTFRGWHSHRHAVAVGRLVEPKVECFVATVQAFGDHARHAVLHADVPGDVDNGAVVPVAGIEREAAEELVKVSRHNVAIRGTDKVKEIEGIPPPEDGA